MRKLLPILIPIVMAPSVWALTPMKDIDSSIFRPANLVGASTSELSPYLQYQEGSSRVAPGASETYNFMRRTSASYAVSNLGYRDVSITCPMEGIHAGYTLDNVSGVPMRAPEHGNTLAVLGGGMLGLAAFRRKLRA